MKKSELSTLIIGSQIENKKNNEVFTINNIIEIDSKVKYHLSNDKTITASSMLRWYNLVQQETVEQVELPIVPAETVEPETVEVEIVEPDTTVEPVEPTPVEVKPVEVKPVNLVDQMIEYCNIHKDKYIVKHNSDHIAIKGIINKRNLVEIHSSKRAINLVVRHQIFSEEEQMILNNCRIVGNGTFTLDLKFEITKLDEFVNTLNRASVYVPVKK